MKNFDQFELDTNIQLKQYRRANNVKGFSGSDLKSKVESIDDEVSSYLDQSGGWKYFFSAQQQDDLFSNAILLLGHLTKGWHLLHHTPQNDEHNWQRLDVPEKAHHGIFQIFQFNEKNGRFTLNDPIQVFSTSGTTSQSKLVPITRSRLLANLIASEELYFDCKKMLSVMPLGHVNSICGALTYSFCYNVNFVHSDFTSVVYMNKLLEIERPELLNCSPFFLETIVKLNEKLKTPSRLPSRIVCASAPLEEHTLQKITANGSLVQPAYGLSEAVNFSLGFGSNDKYSAHDILREFQFLPTGRPLAGNIVKIFNDENDEQPENTVGNVSICGDIVFDGYLANDVPSSLFNSSDGSSFLQTGDTGFIRVIDGCPYVKITGRTKETLNFRGTQYYFRDLEYILLPIINEEFYLTDAVVFDSGIARDSCLCIAILKSGDLAKSSEQKNAIAKKISKLLMNIPFTIWSVTSFPRTKSGKIQRLKRISHGKKIFG